eukprot:COSAG03_NODE_11175_length_607_cov_1011.600394_3_plen_23_part_01
MRRATIIDRRRDALDALIAASLP